MKRNCLPLWWKLGRTNKRKRKEFVKAWRRKGIKGKVKWKKKKKKKRRENCEMNYLFLCYSFCPFLLLRGRWPSSQYRPNRSEAGTQLTAFSQISAHASGVWRHPHPLVPISIWDFYFDISQWHILSARAWTSALMLHLTNPCAKRKALTLTKPKGKIYKTKSLRHYITLLPVRVDQGVMVMNGYFILPRSPELESHHQMKFTCISRNQLFGRVLLLCNG